MEIQLIGRALIPLAIIAAVPLLTAIMASARHQGGRAQVAPPKGALLDKGTHPSVWAAALQGLTDGLPASLVLVYCCESSAIRTRCLSDRAA